MKKCKLADLKTLVKSGLAHDVTNAPADEILELWKHCDKIGYSLGVHGINGGLLIDTTTGKLYAITARNSNLFIIF